METKAETIVIPKQIEKERYLAMSTGEMEQALRDMGAEIVHPSVVPVDPMAIKDGKVLAVWVDKE